MKNGLIEKNRSLALNKVKATHPKTKNGKTSDKYPVVLDGGRTVIFVSDRSKEIEIRERYEMSQRKLHPDKSHITD
jgi:hypothetical protein